MDTVLTILFTSGIAAVIISFILDVKKRRKEKAEKAYAMVYESSSFLQSGIRTIKAYTDGKVSEEQFLISVEKFRANKFQSTENLSAIILFHFPKVFKQLQQFGECFSKFKEITDKGYQGLVENREISEELDKLSEKFESISTNLLIAIIKEGYR
jgi:hypothetical protein